MTENNIFKKRPQKKYQKITNIHTHIQQTNSEGVWDSSFARKEAVQNLGNVNVQENLPLYFKIIDILIQTLKTEPEE
jgi:hypothetical protein